ncbi:SRPBCC domain-containing protein [Saccharomonospora sp. NPDC046836]|uniref:SRPBCC domain-containing protein n=1 Tax=Saccharomonospora sp. NPDC046836 TaxID=3156921 RepID=UPI0034009E9E
MPTIETTIDIDAQPGRAWEVLVDFPAHPDWDPFILNIAGELRPGARLAVTVAPPGGEPMEFRPKVVDVTRGAALPGWGGSVCPDCSTAATSFCLRRCPMGVPA